MGECEHKSVSSRAVLDKAVVGGVAKEAVCDDCGAATREFLDNPHQLQPDWAKDENSQQTTAAVVMRDGEVVDVLTIATGPVKAYSTVEEVERLEQYAKDIAWAAALEDE